jgi:hypothetical protein
MNGKRVIRDDTLAVLNTKRVMRELACLCRAYCSENHKNWAYELDRYARLLNVVEHETTNRTPFQMQFGSKPHFEIRKLLELPEFQLKISLPPSNWLIRI